MRTKLRPFDKSTSRAQSMISFDKSVRHVASVPKEADIGPLSLALLLVGEQGLACLGVHTFERAAATEIKSKLSGTEAKVTVKIETDPVSVLWGAVHRATIHATSFQVDGLPLFVEPRRSRAGRCGLLVLDLNNFRLRGLQVESLFAKIPACRYDRGLALSNKSFRLSRSGTGWGKVRVREEALETFVLKKFPDIKSISIKIDRNVVWAEGYGEFLIIKTPFSVVASLKAVDGTKLHLSDAKVWFDWRRADPLATDALLKSLNPIVDFDADLGLLGSMRVESMTLADGVLEARGPVRIPDSPGGPNTEPKRQRLD